MDNVDRQLAMQRRLCMEFDQYLPSEEQSLINSNIGTSQTEHIDTVTMSTTIHNNKYLNPPSEQAASKSKTTMAAAVAKATMASLLQDNQPIPPLKQLTLLPKLMEQSLASSYIYNASVTEEEGAPSTGWLCYHMFGK